MTIERDDVPALSTPVLPAPSDVVPRLVDEDDRVTMRSTVRRAPAPFVEALLSHAEAHGGFVGPAAVDVAGTRERIERIHAARAHGRKLMREARLVLDDALAAEADIAERALVALAALEAGARLGPRNARLEARELRALQSASRRPKTRAAARVSGPAE